MAGFGDLVSTNVSKTFRVNKNLNRMRAEMQRVNEVTAGVKRIRLAEQLQRSVEEYMERVEAATKEAIHLAEESSQQASCLGGLCWKNPMFGRRVFKNLTELKELANEGREYVQRDLTQLVEKSPREQAERRPTEVGEETLNSQPGIREQAMSGRKTRKQLLHIMDVLRNSPHEFEDVVTKLFELILRVSYDNLSRSRKSCFLSSCLYPKHHKISRKELVDLWIGEGFLEKGAALKGYTIIQELIRQHLLEEHDDDLVTLHDVARDMALWIARHDNEDEDEEKFFVRAGTLLAKKPDVEAMDGIKRMSLMETGIEVLDISPACNSLTTLFLNGNPLRTIRDGFFSHMPMLKVLNFSNNPKLTQLPPEISTLVHLEFLDLSNSGIQELPEWLKLLKNLKILNLENTHQLHTIPAGLISALPKLRVLRMLGCGSSQATEGSLLSDGGSRLMEEAEGLQNLEIFTTTLRNSEAVDNFLRFPELQKRTQCLQLQNLYHKKLFTFSAENMETLETMSISNCRHVELLKFDCRGEVPRVPGDLSRLKVVEIDSCPKLTDLTWLVLASNLSRLVVSNCPNMTEIIDRRKLGQCPDQVNPFRALRSLKLKNLRELVGIYKDALTLGRLKEITVDGCEKLCKLPLDRNFTMNRDFTIHGQRIWWDQLVWEDPSTRRAFFAFFQAMN